MNEKLSIAYCQMKKENRGTEYKYMISFVKKEKSMLCTEKRPRMLHIEPDMGCSGEQNGRRERTEISPFHFISFYSLIFKVSMLIFLRWKILV